MPEQGPKTDAGKGTGATRPATGLHLDHNKSPVLSVGESDLVYIGDTGLTIERKDGAIVIFDGDEEIVRTEV